MGQPKEFFTQWIGMGFFHSQWSLRKPENKEQAVEELWTVVTWLTGSAQSRANILKYTIWVGAMRRVSVTLHNPWSCSPLSPFCLHMCLSILFPFSLISSFCCFSRSLLPFFLSRRSRMTEWKENGLEAGKFGCSEPQASYLWSWESDILTSAL